MDLIKLHGIPRYNWSKIIAEEKWRPIHKHYRAGDPCPRCGELMNDDSECIDVGVGSNVQVTYLMNCYGCGLEAGNSGRDIMYFEWGEDGEAHEWIDQNEL